MLVELVWSGEIVDFWGCGHQPQWYWWRGDHTQIGASIEKSCGLERAFMHIKSRADERIEAAFLHWIRLCAMDV